MNDNLGAKRTTREDRLAHNTPQVQGLFLKDKDQIFRSNIGCIFRGFCLIIDIAKGLRAG